MKLKISAPTILICISAVFSVISLVLYTKKPAEQVISASKQNLWVIYNPYFGNPAIDGKYIGWRYLRNSFPEEWMEPPLNPAIHLFPQRGLYSTHDKSILEDQFKELSEMGVSGVIVQWIGFNKTTQVNNEDVNFVPKTIELMLDVAGRYNIGISVLLQSYEYRRNTSVYDSLNYILSNFSSHQSYLKYEGKPVVFIYDPHDLEDLFWSIIKTRETYNPFYVGTFSKKSQIAESVETDMDALFTWFAANRSESSEYNKWKQMYREIEEHGIKFIPGVCPGFDEAHMNVGFGNMRASSTRLGGDSYKRMWEAAIRNNDGIIIINSYNGFSDASNIEPAISTAEKKYTDSLWTSESGKPNDFIEITKQMMKNWRIALEKRKKFQ